MALLPQLRCTGASLSFIEMGAEEVEIYSKISDRTKMHKKIFRLMRLNSLALIWTPTLVGTCSSSKFPRRDPHLIQILYARLAHCDFLISSVPTRKHTYFISTIAISIDMIFGRNAYRSHHVYVSVTFFSRFCGNFTDYIFST